MVPLGTNSLDTGLARDQVVCLSETPTNLCLVLLTGLMSMETRSIRTSGTSGYDSEYHVETRELGSRPDRRTLISR